MAKYLNATVIVFLVPESPQTTHYQQRQAMMVREPKVGKTLLEPGTRETRRALAPYG
jgi:hypothetical protein